VGVQVRRYRVLSDVGLVRVVPVEPVEDPVCGGQGAAGALAQRRLDVAAVMLRPSGDVREAVLAGVHPVGAGDQERDRLRFDLLLASGCP